MYVRMCAFLKCPLAQRITHNTHKLSLVALIETKACVFLNHYDILYIMHLPLCLYSIYTEVRFNVIFLKALYALFLYTKEYCFTSQKNCYIPF